MFDRCWSGLMPGPPDRVVPGKAGVWLSEVLSASLDRSCINENYLTRYLLMCKIIVQDIYAALFAITPESPPGMVARNAGLMKRNCTAHRLIGILQLQIYTVYYM